MWDQINLLFGFGSMLAGGCTSRTLIRTAEGNLGALLGALVSAAYSVELRWVAPAGDRIGSYLAGGALMGFGALLAGGCNIGQGLTVAATLSATSLLAVAGILGGMVLGMIWVSR